MARSISFQATAAAGTSSGSSSTVRRRSSSGSRQPERAPITASRGSSTCLRGAPTARMGTSPGVPSGANCSPLARRYVEVRIVEQRSGPDAGAARGGPCRREGGAVEKRTSSGARPAGSRRLPADRAVRRGRLLAGVLAGGLLAGVPIAPAVRRPRWRPEGRVAGAGKHGRSGRRPGRGPEAARDRPPAGPRPAGHLCRAPPVRLRPGAGQVSGEAWDKPTLPPWHGVWYLLRPSGLPLPWSGSLTTTAIKGRTVLAALMLTGAGWEPFHVYAYSKDSGPPSWPTAAGPSTSTRRRGSSRAASATRLSAAARGPAWQAAPSRWSPPDRQPSTRVGAASGLHQPGPPGGHRKDPWSPWRRPPLPMIAGAGAGSLASVTGAGIRRRGRWPAWWRCSPR